MRFPRNGSIFAGRLLASAPAPAPVGKAAEAVRRTARRRWEGGGSVAARPAAWASAPEMPSEEPAGETRPEVEAAEVREHPFAILVGGPVPVA